MFCTTINCMDGRVQLPVINYLQKRFKADYVDSITEPGPIAILAKQTNKFLVESIFTRLKISVDHHHSVGIAVVGHYDCAGNPVLKNIQVSQVKDSIKLIRQYYPNMDIIGLWVDENWQVEELTFNLQ